MAKCLRCHRLDRQVEQLGAEAQPLGEAVAAEGVPHAAVDRDRQGVCVAEPPGQLHRLGRGLVAAIGVHAIQLEGQGREQTAAQQLLTGWQHRQRMLDRAHEFLVGASVLGRIPRPGHIERGDQPGEQDRVAERQRGADGVPPETARAGNLLGGCQRADQAQHQLEPVLHRGTAGPVCGGDRLFP